MGNAEIMHIKNQVLIQQQRIVTEMFLKPRIVRTVKITKSPNHKKIPVWFLLVIGSVFSVGHFHTAK